MGSSSGGGGGRLLSDIVDTIAVLVLVGLAVGVHHGGLVSFAGEAVLLEMALLLAVPAGGIGISNSGGGVSLIVGDMFLLEAKNSKLAKLIIWQIFPNDLLRFIFP